MVSQLERSLGAGTITEVYMLKPLHAILKHNKSYLSIIERLSFDFILAFPFSGHVGNSKASTAPYNHNMSTMLIGWI